MLTGEKLLTQLQEALHEIAQCQLKSQALEAEAFDANIIPKIEPKSEPGSNTSTTAASSASTDS